MYKDDRFIENIPLWMFFSIIVKREDFVKKDVPNCNLAITNSIEKSR